MPVHNRQELIERTIVAEMVSAAEAANLPQSFIDHIKVRQVGDNKWQIYNDLKGPNDEPLARWLEFGTRDHWIEGNPVLAWEHKGPGRSARPAIYHQREDTKEGDILFSTGHYVKGLPRLEAMTKGFKKGVERMKEELNSGR